MLKFYVCEHCGNIVTKLTSSGVPLKCCGQNMKVLEAGVTDAAVEKHVPAVTVDGNLVKVVVGSVVHPMAEEHHIAWIVLHTNKGVQVKYLDHTGAPEAVFALAEGEELIAAYEYCNLHGLWKKEV